MSQLAVSSPGFPGLFRVGVSQERPARRFQRRLKSPRFQSSYLILSGIGEATGTSAERHHDHSTSQTARASRPLEHQPPHARALALDRRGPHFVKLGGRVVYRLDDIEAFERAQVRDRNSLPRPRRSRPMIRAVPVPQRNRPRQRSPQAAPHRHRVLRLGRRRPGPVSGSSIIAGSWPPTRSRRWLGSPMRNAISSATLATAPSGPPRPGSCTSCSSGSPPTASPTSRSPGRSRRRPPRRSPRSCSRTPRDGPSAPLRQSRRPVHAVPCQRADGR